MDFYCGTTGPPMSQPSQPNWIKSALGWASAIPHNFTAPARRAIAASALAIAPPFPDVNTNHWASDYIQTLASLRIISGFPDGSFRPDAPVTRAQFAAILRNAFPTDVDLRNVKPFSDVAPSYWATSAIRTTRATGFLSGYPGNRFRPEQNIPRVQALVALANGLNYSSRRLTDEPSDRILSYYQDSSQIPGYAVASIAAATDFSLVVNYPNLRQLNPNRNASRAEIAAFVYQALYQEAKAPAVALNPYRVIATSQPWQTEPSATLPVQAARFSFNGPGTRLATLDAKTNLIKVWDLTTARSLTSINAGLQRQFTAMVLSEDGDTVVAVVESPSSTGSIRTLNAWSVATSQPLWEQPFEPELLDGPATSQLANELVLSLTIRPRHREVLTQASLALAPEGQFPNTQLQLHSLETGEVTQTIKASPGIELLKFTFDPQGNDLAALGTVPADGPFSSRNQRIELWQLDGNSDNGSRLPSLIPADRFPNSNLAYSAIAFTPNGSLRAIAQSLNDIRLDTWDIRRGNVIDAMTQLPDIDRQDRFGRLSPDGVWYFVRSDVVGTRLIDTQLGSLVSLEIFVRQVAFSGKGEQLAIADNTIVQVFSQINSLR